MRKIEKTVESFGVLVLITLGVLSACAFMLCVQSFIDAALVNL